MVGGPNDPRLDIYKAAQFQDLYYRHRGQQMTMLENGLYNNDRAKIDQGKIAELHDRSLATDPSYLAKLIKTYGTNDADKLINVGQHIDNNHSLYVNNPRLFTGMLSFVG